MFPLCAEVSHRIPPRDAGSPATENPHPVQCAGPLINPAHPPLALIGVYSPELVLPIAETLRVLGYQRAAVVHSGRMDEVSLHRADNRCRAA